mmetsp:Transcript_35126/g.80421  ORF Transcript_35126/g.80421 Transcript_35126/m.80421 type:complete len:271 (-) Transcript_35126:2225-3037(-)
MRGSPPPPLSHIASCSHNSSGVGACGGTSLLACLDVFGVVHADAMVLPGPLVDLAECGVRGRTEYDPVAGADNSHCSSQSAPANFVRSEALRVDAKAVRAGVMACMAFALLARCFTRARNSFTDLLNTCAWASRVPCMSCNKTFASGFASGEVRLNRAICARHCCLNSSNAARSRLNSCRLVSKSESTGGYPSSVSRISPVASSSTTAEGRISSVAFLLGTFPSEVSAPSCTRLSSTRSGGCSMTGTPAANLASKLTGVGLSGWRCVNPP